MPIGAVAAAGVSLFALARRLREELGVNTVCGAPNISFGLPDRVMLNGAFLTMAIGAGMTCAITNPLEEDLRKLILAADVMMAHDDNCASWLAAQRPAGDGAREERLARRERRRAQQGV